MHIAQAFKRDNKTKKKKSHDNNNSATTIKKSQLKSSTAAEEEKKAACRDWVPCQIFYRLPHIASELRITTLCAASTQSYYT